jgi:hypothetical protein
MHLKEFNDYRCSLQKVNDPAVHETQQQGPYRGQK